MEAAAHCAGQATADDLTAVGVSCTALAYGDVQACAAVVVCGDLVRVQVQLLEAAVVVAAAAIVAGVDSADSEAALVQQAAALQSELCLHCLRLHPCHMDCVALLDCPACGAALAGRRYDPPQQLQLVCAALQYLLLSLVVLYQLVDSCEVYTVEIVIVHRSTSACVASVPLPKDE